MIIENEDMGNLGDFSFFFTNERKKNQIKEKSLLCYCKKTLWEAYRTRC